MRELLRRPVGVLLLDYGAVEGVGAVSTRKLPIKVPVSVDEKFGRGWQCPPILIGGCHSDGDWDFCTS